MFPELLNTWSIFPLGHGEFCASGHKVVDSNIGCRRVPSRTVPRFGGHRDALGERSTKKAPAATAPSDRGDAGSRVCDPSQLVANAGCSSSVSTNRNSQSISTRVRVAESPFKQMSVAAPNLRRRTGEHAIGSRPSRHTDKKSSQFVRTFAAFLSSGSFAPAHPRAKDYQWPRRPDPRVG